MKNWTKLVTPTKEYNRPVFVTIQYKDGRLSITGVEGPDSNGNAHGGAGQIELNPDNNSYGWSYEDVKKLKDIWDRWHLNNMRAGSPNQEQWLNNNKDQFPGYPVSHYEWASQKLSEAGINPDNSHNGYLYGSAWLKEEVPQDVLDWLQSLPETTRTHPWASLM